MKPIFTCWLQLIRIKNLKMDQIENRKKQLNKTVFDSHRKVLLKLNKTTF